ncbi:MAG: hypothetical protein EAX96_03855 [Candidatus Lokiarchaeota archaeon]|nr:hypothetical protein [Candidatus Lokiarchaeota archaeon]
MSIKIDNPKIREILDLDDFPLNKVIHLYGIAGSGKSTFCLQIAFLLAKQGFKSLYIDTISLYSVNRLKQISGSLFDKLSSLILFSNPKSFDEQNRLIDNLSNFINDDIKLIVIDDIISYYRAEIAKKPKGIRLNKMLNQQVAQLKDLSTKNKLMVVIVNQVRADLANPDNVTTPLSKKIFDHWSDMEVKFLTHSEEKGARISILKKTFDKKSLGIKCIFKISQEGFI